MQEKAVAEEVAEVAPAVVEVVAEMARGTVTLLAGA